MRRRLLSAITMGVGLAACRERREGDGFGVSVGDTSATSGGISIDTSSAASSSSEGDAPSREDRPVFDLGPLPDTPFFPPGCERMDEPPRALGSTCAVLVDENPQVVTACMPADADGQCAASETRDVIDLLEMCNGWMGDACMHLESACGPQADEAGSCCYWGSVEGVCPGRPFTINGVARLAPAVVRADWCLAWPLAASAEFYERLSEGWRFDGRHEHAAIASFSRFALQLLAMAAPAEFVAAALRAAADEHEHAMLFFGLARACSGRAIGPGALAIEGALGDGDDEIAVVVAAVREGCVAETISAMQLLRASTGASEPELRAALGRVVEQELAHVELAWAFVAWAYARGDARLRVAVDDAFAAALRWIPIGADVEPAPEDAERWRAHGRLTRGECRAIAERTVNTIVLPLARELSERGAADGKRMNA